jgi:molecular chaperone GrpE (heat shock protein)
MTDKIIELTDDDFSAQMQGLVDAATQAIEEREAAVRSIDVSRPKVGPHPLPKPEVEKAEKSEKPEKSEKSEKIVPMAESLEKPEKAGKAEAAPTEDRAKPASNLPEMLRPLVDGLKAMGRVSGEQTHILNRIDKLTADANGARQQLPQIVADLQAMTEQRNVVSRQMFDALHEELRSYKDGFLLDTVHRPMIRDLISLYDDLVEIHRQMSEAVDEQAAAAAGGTLVATFVERLESIEMHIEHNIEFVLEVLARLEVARLPVGSGKLEKLTQRAVAVEMADNPDDDLTIVRVFKRGFLWKGRVLRPEEVGIKKWKEGFLMAIQADAEKK